MRINVEKTRLIPYEHPNRETLSSVDLTHECTNTLKTLGRPEQCRVNLLTYEETLRRLDQ